jgi:plastocyanin
MEKRIVSLIALVIGAVWMIFNFGQSAPAHANHASSPNPVLRPSQTVTIQFGGSFGFAYSPKDVFILPGDEVRWQGSFVDHPLVSEDGLWQMVDSGSEFTFTFNQPGVYHYHCFFHNSIGMNGTVTVGYRVLLPLIQN